MRTLNQIKKHHAVAEAWYEGEDGYWIWLKETYISPDMECRTIHEHSLKELNDKLDNVISIN